MNILLLYYYLRLKNEFEIQIPQYLYNILLLTWQVQAWDKTAKSNWIQSFNYT